MVHTVSVEWHARDVVTWPASPVARPGAMAEVLFQTMWCKVLELNVATGSGVKVVCTFPVRMKGAQRKKRAKFMFGVGKGLHRFRSY